MGIYMDHYHAQIVFVKIAHKNILLCCVIEMCYVVVIDKTPAAIIVTHTHKSIGDQYNILEGRN